MRRARYAVTKGIAAKAAPTAAPRAVAISIRRSGFSRDSSYGRTGSRSITGNMRQLSGLDIQYNCSYILLVKIAISIPDRLFEAAERLAKRLGMSRSELYSKAVANYVGENRSSDVRERLDAVYDRAPELSQLEAGTRRIQSRSISTEKW